MWVFSCQQIHLPASYLKLLSGDEIERPKICLVAIKMISLTIVWVFLSDSFSTTAKTAELYVDTVDGDSSHDRRCLICPAKSLGKGRLQADNDRL